MGGTAGGGVVRGGKAGVARPGWGGGAAVFPAFRNVRFICLGGVGRGRRYARELEILN